MSKVKKKKIKKKTKTINETKKKDQVIMNS